MKISSATTWARPSPLGLSGEDTAIDITTTWAPDPAATKTEARLAAAEITPAAMG
jgi:hypothetical protein